MQNLRDVKEQSNMVNENLILSLTGIYYMTIFNVVHKFKLFQRKGDAKLMDVKHSGRFLNKILVRKRG